MGFVVCNVLGKQCQLLLPVKDREVYEVVLQLKEVYTLMADPNTNKDLGTQGAEDTVAGKTKQTAGKIQKNTGKALGNREMEAKGKAREVGGKVQSKGGKVERKVDKALEE